MDRKDFNNFIRYCKRHPECEKCKYRPQWKLPSGLGQIADNGMGCIFNVPPSNWREKYVTPKPPKQ